MAVAEIAVPIIASIGTFFLGRLSRQPEVNELKKQIKILQGEVTRLQNMVQTQDAQIHKLMDAYRKLSYEEKIQEREYIQGNLIFQYAFKEFLEILIDANNTGSLSLNKEEVRFYNAFGKIIGRAEITSKNRQIVMEYIKEKYGDEIKEFQEPGLDNLIENELREA